MPITPAIKYSEIAAYNDWKVPTGSPLLSASAWIMLPLLRIGKGSLQPVLTVPGYPITLGVAVESAGSTPLIDTNGFSFDGVKLSASIDVAATSNRLTFSLVVLQLQLPGETTAQDTSLASLEAISATQILNTASALFISALSNLSRTQRRRPLICYRR